MTDPTARALKALGWIKAGIAGNYGDYIDSDGNVHQPPSEAELIGMLLLELDRLTRVIRLDGPWAECNTWSCKCVDLDEPQVGATPLEALVLAVEAAKEGK